jgi:chemotaxis protein MotB
VGERSKPEEEEGGDQFMMMFTALMIIVLAFFILLNTMAVVDEQKTRQAIGSLQGSFGVLKGGSAYDEDGRNMDKSESLDEDTAVLESMLKDLKFIVEEKKLGDPSDIGLETGGMFPRLRVSSDVLYGPGGTQISPRAFPILDRVAQAGLGMDATIEIEGQTGPRKVGGPLGTRSNWELSAHRAVNVQRYFVEATRFAPDKVEARGVAEFRSSKPEDRILIVFKTEGASSRGREEKSTGR